MKNITVRMVTSLAIFALLLQTSPIQALNPSLESEETPKNRMPLQDMSQFTSFNEYMFDQSKSDEALLTGIFFTPFKLPAQFEYPHKDFPKSGTKRVYSPPTPEQLSETKAQVESFDCSIVIDVPQIECEALVSLYNSTNGAGWYSRNNWLSTTSVSSWYGIVVVNNHVTEINLNGNWLNGIIPQELSDLVNLQVLWLGNNQLNGTIPPELGSLSNLLVLFLDYNQLTGEIPPELGNLNNLLRLWLYGNQLSGNLPPELGNLENVWEIALHSNPLTGSIPLNFINLTNLIGFYFENTELCEPTNSDFQAWKATVLNWFGTDFLCVPYQQKYLFVPMSWEKSQAEFESISNYQINIFLDEVPLNDCRYQVLVEFLDVETQNFENFTCSDTLLTDIRNFVKNETEFNPSDWDVIIGLSESSPCVPVVGQSNGVNTIWVTTGSDILTAHELGHIYGLSDQYCSTQAGSTDLRCNDGDYWDDGVIGDHNYLDADLPFDCPPDGSDDSSGAKCCNFSLLNNCTLKNYGVCCYGNKNSSGGRSIMSYSNAPGPRAFDDHDLYWLSHNSKLQCIEDQLLSTRSLPSISGEIPGFIMDINLNVFSDNSVEEELIEITQGRPTEDSILESLFGDYMLVIKDQDGNDIVNQSFSLYFDYSGPVFDGVDYSGIIYDLQDVSFRFPYSSLMEELYLYKNDDLIFFKDLPKLYLLFAPLMVK